MDINHDSVPSTPIAIQVLFACKSKTKLQNIIIRDHNERASENFLRSSCLFIIPKVINGSLWLYIYL